VPVIQWATSHRVITVVAFAMFAGSMALLPLSFESTSSTNREPNFDRDHDAGQLDVGQTDAETQKVESLIGRAGDQRLQATVGESPTPSRLQEPFRPTRPKGR
jgi:hypothetical protein